MDPGVALLFQIQPSIGTPIYRQIIDQVQRLVASGTLKPGDELPSIRDMARTFEVNQMTISKAYSLLEARGVLVRKRGKPMSIARTSPRPTSSEQRLDLLRPALMEAVKHARQLAITNDELLEELTKLLEADNAR